MPISQLSISTWKKKGFWLWTCRDKYSATGILILGKLKNYYRNGNMLRLETIDWISLHCLVYRHDYTSFTQSMHNFGSVLRPSSSVEFPRSRCLEKGFSVFRMNYLNLIQTCLAVIPICFMHTFRIHIGDAGEMERI